MKNSLKSLKPFILGAFAIFVAQASANAAVIITPENATSPVVSNSVPNSSAGPANDGTTTGEAGYDIFDYHPSGSSSNGATNITADNVSEFPAYITGLTTDSVDQYYTQSTHLSIAGGTSAGTGLLLGNGSAAAPVDFVTFELTSAVPASFDLGVLQDYGDKDVYTLSVYSGTPSPATLLDSTAISNGAKDSPTVNDFYYGKISGASAGDYVVVSAAPPSGSDQVTIGGITFDAVAAATTPEPATSALMLAGLGLLIAARLRNRAN